MAVSGMADLTANFGLTDKSMAGGFRTSNLLAEDNNYASINDLDTRLSAINAGYYTVTMLRTMTKNDKIYALRLLSSDSTTI